MVEVLTKVEVQNTDNVKQTADALAPLLEAPDEVTTKTQVFKKLLHNFHVWYLFYIYVVNCKYFILKIY